MILHDGAESIESHQSLARKDFEIVLQLASELDLLYENSDNDERRLLCETFFKRITVRDRNIVDAELNPPFALISA